MPATLLDHNIQPYADLEAMLATAHKAMVVAATGAGKTSVTVKYLEDHNLQGLVICPRVSICKQWDAVSGNVATMTYQKFCNEPDVSAYGCYIFDEAHHTGASKWGKAVKNLMSSTDKPVIGLTADPKRYLDGGRDMGQELWDGNVVYGVDLDEAIQKGILPGGIFVNALFDAGAELEKYRNIPVTDILKGRLEASSKNCLSISEILHKHMPEGKRKGIVFVDSIDRIQESIALIQAAYPFEPVSSIHSSRSQKQNAEALIEFNRAKEESANILLTSAKQRASPHGLALSLSSNQHRHVRGRVRYFPSKLLLMSYLFEIFSSPFKTNPRYQAGPNRHYICIQR